MESRSDESEPSYMVVNKQLQDVIRFQHTVIARLKGKVSAQFEWVLIMNGNSERAWTN